MTYLSLKTARRFAVSLAAFAGLAGLAHANEFQNTYSVAPGQVSPPITIYGNNTPVSLTCASNTPSYRGVGQVTILRPNPNQFLEWVGTDIATGAVTSGYSGTLGTHIVYCSYTDQFAEIQVVNDTQIQVKNNSTYLTITGVINQSW